MNSRAPEIAERAAPVPLQANGRDALATFQDLSVGYDRGPVLRSLSFNVHPGEFIAVVGPSGCGKTTLLRALTGQVKRFGGRLALSGVDSSRRVRFGYVPQVETVDWNFPITVEQVVMLGSWRESPWTPWSSKPSREMARATLDRLGIGELRGRHIRALSGGQQQRVFLARALVGKPDVLLLDEPTSGVDIRTRHEVMHLLLELNRAGTTIVLTTHDLNAVSSHATRLLCIADGSIVGDGTPEEVLTPDVLRRTYGAEMLVMRHNGNLYVVEANDSMAIPHVAGS
jgi:zinc/manganese transport system ATP-binding protein